MAERLTLRERLVGTPAHDLLGVWMLLWSYLPAVAALYAFHRWMNLGTFFLAMLVVGVRMNALFVVVHESWHYNLFRSRRLNEWLGGALASYPIMMPYFKDRDAHWNHHRHVGTSRDPNASAWDWTDAQRGAFVKELFVVGTGLSYAARILRLVFRLPPPPPAPGRPERPTLQGKMALFEVARLAVAQAAVFAVFWMTIGWFWYFPLWLFPALSISPAWVTLREFLEHRRGALIVYRAWPVERFLLGCFNFHLHAYHHAHASAPWFVLPVMKERALRKQPDIVYLTSYFLELAAYLRGRSSVPFPADHEPLPAGDVPLADRAATPQEVPA
jgi:fatty acid desaturase